VSIRAQVGISLIVGDDHHYVWPNGCGSRPKRRASNRTDAKSPQKVGTREIVAPVIPHSRKSIYRAGASDYVRIEAIAL
jgi:hypothetical protein